MQSYIEYSAHRSSEIQHSLPSVGCYTTFEIDSWQLCSDSEIKNKLQFMWIN